MNTVPSTCMKHNLICLMQLRVCSFQALDTQMMKCCPKVYMKNEMAHIPWLIWQMFIQVLLLITNSKQIRWHSRYRSNTYFSSQDLLVLRTKFKALCW